MTAPTPEVQAILDRFRETVAAATTEAIDRMMAEVAPVASGPPEAAPKGCIVFGEPTTHPVDWPPASLRSILSEEEWDGRIVKVDACDRHAAHPTRWPQSVTGPLWDRMRPEPA
jgi:hypothetical protein